MKLLVVKRVLSSFQPWFIIFQPLHNSWSIIPLSFLIHQKAEMVLHCCHVMFRLPSLVPHGLLPFELSPTSSSYLIWSTLHSLYTQHIFQFLYFIEIITLTPSQSLLILIPSVLQGSIDYHLLWDALLDFLSKIFLPLCISCSIKYASFTSLTHHFQVLWSRDVIWFLIWLVTTISKPNTDTHGYVFFLFVSFFIYILNKLMK